MNKKIFDTIVIGSGAGGLSTGKSGDKYTFDTGLHYVIGCLEGGRLSASLEVAVGQTHRSLKWNMVDPVEINRYVYNDFEDSFPMGFENFKNSLLYKFPDPKETMNKSFDIVDDIDQTFRKLMQITQNIETKSLFGKIAALSRLVPIFPKILRYTSKTSKEILSEVSDYRDLKILESFSGECGVGLEQATSIVLLIAKYFSNGAFYPQGGTKPLINLFCDTILRNGGQVMKKAGVTSIGKEGDFFKVVTQNREYFSKTIISNTDAKVLYSDLLTQEIVPEKVQKIIQNTVLSASNFYTFVGTDLDLSKYMTSGNVTIFDQNFFDNKSPSSTSSSKIGLNRHFLTSPTLKDPNGGHSTKGKYSLEILSNNCEFATPLSNLHYVSAPNGSMYGPAQTPNQTFRNFYPIETHIPGLYHCGSSTTFAGVSSCLSSGLDAAKKLLGHHKL
ncbi:hypothetical protein M0812_08672 [Anaeramoeba flamelloides]|uniref:Amine oxidase domain-containing protein n=1 Tax=Anaeramoeba flamelloides TaxID=1746091 RepID=A0AAV7ZXT8_9EUKA|nr:hypothetical protein M0812_08672 [Anaeramoeba flamelloides]